MSGVHGGLRKCMHILILRTHECALIWKRVLADVIKNLEMRLSWITWGQEKRAKSNDKWSQKMQKRRPGTGRPHEEEEAEVRVREPQLQNAWGHQKL